MVGVRFAVGFAAAAPEVHADPIPAGPVKPADDAPDIGPGRSAFQAVKRDQHFVAAGPGPVQVDKVAVGGSQPLPLIIHALNLPEQGGVNGVEVSVPKNPRRLVCAVFDKRHSAQYSLSFGLFVNLFDSWLGCKS